ncbi:hypothetical protein [Microcoleus sp. A006_D1]|uniref:hypothetical protein n=1 Tax=Microcoleus sp. A006_D1 TaxID=3055267 RepID=UPI002FD15798
MSATCQIPLIAFYGRSGDRLHKALPQVHEVHPSKPRATTGGGVAPTKPGF